VRGMGPQRAPVSKPLQVDSLVPEHQTEHWARVEGPLTGDAPSDSIFPCRSISRSSKPKLLRKLKTAEVDILLLVPV